ncbi:hypothetical protein D3C78_482640 [compost metagenome]
MLRATAEVQTNTNGRTPLGVAVVDVVHGFYAGTGEEHVGDVPLGASANVGEGGVVAAATSGLAQALVSETGGNVRTQSVAHGTEVVGGVELGLGTFDVFIEDFTTSVVGLVVAEVQGNVVGQEVAQANTRIGAVVLEVTFAVVVLLGNVAFDFHSALALSQNAERSSSDERANGQAQGVFQFHPLNPHLVIVKQSHHKQGGQLDGKSSRTRRFVRDICMPLSFIEAGKFLPKLV